MNNTTLDTIVTLAAFGLPLILAGITFVAHLAWEYRR